MGTFACVRDANHVYHTVDGLAFPSVTTIIRTVLAGGSSFADSELARVRGNHVHTACSLADRLDWGTLDEDLHGYVHAWSRFVSEWRYQPEGWERPLVDAALRLGGTPDTWGTLVTRKQRLRAICDLKTGAETPWEGEQLAGYDLLLYGPGPHQTVRVAVHLRPDGTYRPTVFASAQDYTNISAAARVFWARVQKGSLEWP